MGGIAVGPLNWFWDFVVVANVAHELALEIGDGSEDAACDDVALDALEPQLNLVKPRGVGGGRSESGHLARMVGQKPAHALGLLGREMSQMI